MTQTASRLGDLDSTKAQELTFRGLRRGGRPGHFAESGSQEGPAPKPHRQGRPEEHQGLHALSSLASPVDVLEVEPQREFIESQGRPDPYATEVRR